MSRSFVQFLLKKILKQLLGVKEREAAPLKDIKNILIVRQHNQLGDMLVGSSLINALHEQFSEAKITFVASPQNKAALENNPYLSKLLVFDKKQLFKPAYFSSFKNEIRSGFDLCLAPATVSLSFTNDLIARLSKSKVRVGISELDGRVNEFAFFFDHRVAVDWRAHPETHVAKRILAILSPFGITTSLLSPVIMASPADYKNADKILQQGKDQKIIIGLHTGAGKPPNRWPAEKFCQLIERFRAEMNAFCYLTASSADAPIIAKINEHFTEKLPVFLNQSISSVAALISRSHLFVTNDTGIMHVAAATETPQISLFGPTDPYVWGPLGNKKLNLQNTDAIDRISVEEVWTCVIDLLTEN